MKSPPFDYHAPETVAEAISLLAGGGPDAKILAGGQSLMPLLNMRLARPAVVVDINRIAELQYLKANGELAVGALVRHADLLRHPEVRQRWPLLAEATAYVGHPAIRNRGTVCGSIAHADPAAEHPAVLTALDGRVVVAGPRGRRELAPEEFFLAGLMTALEPDELVVEVRFPALPPGTGTNFVELARRLGDFAIVGVAAALTVENGVCREARLALTGVGDVPFRARAAEAALVGQSLAGDDAAMAFVAAGNLVAAAVDPPEDVHASAQYRRHVAGVLTEQALTRALARVGGK